MKWRIFGYELKDLIVKALSYDRNQYEKGYRAAKSEIVQLWRKER